MTIRSLLPISRLVSSALPRIDSGAGTVVPIIAMLTVALAPWAGAARADSGPAAGSADAAPSGSIVFARGSALWRIPAGEAIMSRPPEPEVIADLGDDATRVTRIEASPSGDAVLVELGDKVAWVPIMPDRNTPGTLHLLECSGPANFTPRGRSVTCTGRNGQVALHSVPPTGARPLYYPASHILGFAPGKRVVIRNPEGLWADSVHTPGEPTLLAPHTPAGTLLVSPDGKRAAGVYPPLRRADTPGLYVFRLDGKGIRRRLLQGAEPLAWSMNGRWLLAQSEDEGACIVRAAGGQYKCWARYDAVALSPDGAHVLLSKGSENEGRGLYVGQLAGVRPDPPKLVQRAISGPTVWLPPHQSAQFQPDQPDDQP